MPADFLEGSLPVLLKTSLSRREELLLRSYLGLPLILDAHVSDCRGSPNALADVAESINGQGNVCWTSVEGILRTNFEHRVRGTRLQIRPYARRVVVSVPEWTTEVEVLPPPTVDPVDYIFCEPDGQRLLEVVGNTCFLNRSDKWGSTSIAISMNSTIEHVKASATRGIYRGLARRLLTEARDRAQPLLDTRLRLR
jgi:hypothetical protein